MTCRKPIAIRGWSRGRKTHLGFALAKAMEDTGQYDRVFRYLREANAGMRALHGYDRSGRRQLLDDIMAAFRDVDFAPRETAPAGPTPVFITSLPRSGSTLVEQILASHSRVDRLVASWAISSRRRSVFCGTVRGSSATRGS